MRVPAPRRSKSDTARCVHQPSENTVERLLTDWDPVITAVATAATTGHTPAELADTLDYLGATTDHAALAATLAVSGLALLALQTEIKIDRNTAGEWQFRLHKKALRDSTLGQLLALDTNPPQQ
jgi:hypothetical protein